MLQNFEILKIVYISLNISFYKILHLTFVLTSTVRIWILIWKTDLDPQSSKIRTQFGSGSTTLRENLRNSAFNFEITKTRLYPTPELVKGLGYGRDLVCGLALLPPEAVLLLEVMLQLLQHIRLLHEGRTLYPVLGRGQVSQLTLPDTVC